MENTNTDVNANSNDNVVDVEITTEDTEKKNDVEITVDPENKDQTTETTEETNENTNTTDYSELLEKEEFKTFLKSQIEAQNAELLEKLKIAEQKKEKLMDELKPLKQKFKDEHTLTLFKNGDVEGFRKAIEEETSEIYKDIISQEKIKYEQEKEQLSNTLKKVEEERDNYNNFIKTEKAKDFLKDKGIKEEALDDAVNFLKEEFNINQDFNFEHKSVQEYTIDNWLESQRTKRNYLFSVFNGTGVSKNNRMVNLGKTSLNELDINNYKKERAKQDGLI